MLRNRNILWFVFAVGVLVNALFCGCATQRQAHTYAGPAGVKDRIMPVVMTMTDCMTPGTYYAIRIEDDRQWNASMSYRGDLTYLAGMLKSDDEVLIFVTAHELAHFQLGHHKKRMGISAVTTYAMLVVNSVVPGAGLLNRAINPAITNNFSKAQELDADGAAAKACMRCLGFTKEKVVEIMQRKKKMAATDGGGFWDKHPSWDERIAHVEGLLTTVAMPEAPAVPAK